MSTGRPAPTQEELKRVLDDLFSKVLADGEMVRAMRPPGPPDWIPEGADDADDPASMAEAEARWEEQRPMARVRELSDYLLINDCEPVMTDLNAVLATRDLSGVDRASPQFRVFVREAMRIYIQAREIDAEREEAGYVEDTGENRRVPAPLLAPTALPFVPMALANVDRQTPAIQVPTSGATLPAATAPAAPAPMFGEEYEAWRRAMAGNAWRDEHAVDSATAWKLWRELIGDCRLDQVTNRQAWDFRELLGRVPKLHGKSVFKGLTAREAIERANAIEANEYDPSHVSDILKIGEKVARLSKKTQNKHSDFLIGFFNWQGLADHNLGNPFSGTLHKKREIRRDASPTRTSLTDEEQVRLFTTPLWRGSVSPYFRAQPRPVDAGGVIIRDALFWVPLLAAFQGFRLHEALQLFVEDIVEAHGTHWICVKRGPGRHVKTEAGVREVPLHPEIRRIGFLEYIEQQRAAGRPRLFHDYAPKIDEDAQRARFSKNFGNYRRVVGCAELWKDLHAERHCVDTVLMRARQPARLIAEICGHEGGHLEARPMHMTNRLYFGGYKPQQLIEAVNLIVYEGLDLSHLYTDATAISRATTAAEAAE